MALSRYDGTPETRKALAESNDNWRLYRLKKYQLQEICMHYDLDPYGTKGILEQRIISERDAIYHLSFHDPPQITITQISSRYRIRNVTKDTFQETNKHHILNGMHINREPKINIVTIYNLLHKLNDPTYDKTYLNVFETKSRNELISGIRIVCDRIIASHPPPRPRKTLHIQNLSDQIVYIYYSKMRNDNPRFSQCNFLMNILPGNTKNMYYYDDNTNIIFSKMNIGREVYYMDLQEQSAVIQENLASSLNGRIEFKGNKGELEQWKEAALKADFLIKQLKRLGIEKNENFNAIVDLHQDITIPEHSERDKEIAGIPSTLTNVT